MAFLEGKLQPIDLLAALQARRQFEQTSEQRRQQELQNKLMQEQLEAAEWANLKAKERPTITLPAGPGLGGMREKQFLDQQAGYISGVSPTDTFNQWQQNFRTGMTAGGGGGGGRSGGMVGGGQVAPGSYKTYDQLNNEAALQYNQAVADQAESQAKAADMAQSGYGSATAEGLARDKIEAMGVRGGKGGGVAAGPMYPDASPAELLGLVKSGNAIQTPEDYGANWQADRDAESAATAANLSAQNYLAGAGESSLKGLSLEDQLNLRGAKNEMGASKDRSTKIEKYGRELYNKAERLADKMYKHPEFVKLGESPQGQALQAQLKAKLFASIGRAYEAGEPFILDEYINQNAAKIYSK